MEVLKNVSVGFLTYTGSQLAQAQNSVTFLSLV